MHGKKSNVKIDTASPIFQGMPEEIDTVSRATCSSNAIIDGCKKALEMALRPEETEAQ